MRRPPLNPLENSLAGCEALRLSTSKEGLAARAFPEWGGPPSTVGQLHRCEYITRCVARRSRSRPLHFPLAQPGPATSPP
ncbi:hypothetical protein ACN38_g10897 [Penicillium nordicum]|uniref:Uncharacterized protein n=1 Tax=Penicillium nordicum TaxID=229535 RepID=A0A0M9WB80_9EURO|nr:hypothetical protein ACN38_g10897 [Penicillium nordicum]